MRYNGKVKYCEHCDKKTYHYPDGSCSSCYAEACGISTEELGQARRKRVAQDDKMMSEAIQSVKDKS